MSTHSAGARNAIGVDYQARYSALVLLEGVMQQPVIRVIPEGAEDIDVTLESESRVYIQLKYRRAGLGLSELSEAISKAWIAAGHSDHGSAVAVVSNTNLFGGFGGTGWERTLAHHSSIAPAPLARLLERVQKNFHQSGVTIAAQEALARTHLVHWPGEAVDLERAVLRLRPRFTPLQAQIISHSIVAAVYEAISMGTPGEIDTPNGLTPQSLLVELERGATLAGAWLHEVESERLVVPTDFLTVPPEDRPAYLRGVRATPSHIGAGYPVPRSTEEGRIRELAQSSPGGIIVGQSGSGKSTLLWQAAHTLSRDMPTYTLRRVTEPDVGSILALLETLSTRPLLLCVDDLGDVGFDGWNALIRGLIALPHVRVLAACREDLFELSMLAGRLSAIRAPLLREDAHRIAEALRVGPQALPTSEVDQLLADSRGLMMEFVHLAVTSSRLAQTLSLQGELLATSSNELTAHVARVILAADVCGFAVPVYRLRALAASDSDLACVLAHLTNEHVVRSDGRQLSGLHFLRSSYLVKSLHANYPPLADTLSELFPIAPLSALVRLSRWWIAENPNSTAELARLIADRFLSEPRMDWNILAPVCLKVEIAAYLPSYDAYMSTRDASLNAVLLRAVGDGRASLTKGSFYDLANVPLTDMAFVERLAQLKDTQEVFDALPTVPPIRRLIVEAIRAKRSMPTESLTVGALSLFRDTDCFLAAELEPLCQRIVSALTSEDDSVLYDEWRTETARVRLSRAWAGRAASAVARLGQEGRETISRHLEGQGERAAVLALQSFVNVLNSGDQDCSRRPRVLQPIALLSRDDQLKFLKGSLADAGSLENLNWIHAQIVSPSGGDPYWPLRHENPDLTVNVLDQVQEASLYGLAYVEEYRSRRERATWFEWLDEVAVVVSKVVTVLRSSISALLTEIHSAGRGRRQLLMCEKELARIDDTINTLPEPPDASLFAFDMRDIVAHWAFGVATQRFPGWRPADTPEIGIKALPFALSSVLQQFLRAVKHVHSRTTLVEQSNALDKTAALAHALLSAHVQALGRFPTARAHDLVLEVWECLEALYAIRSSDQYLSEFSSRSLIRGVAATLTEPGRAVRRLNHRISMLTETTVARERTAAETLARSIGHGWRAMPVPHGGQLGSSVAPRWVLLGPISTSVGGPELHAALDGNGWATHRTIVLLRRPGGTVRECFQCTDGWPTLSKAEILIVKGQLRHLGFSLGHNGFDEKCPPMRQFLTLLTAISHEMAAERLGGPPPLEWQADDLWSLCDKSAESRFLIGRLEAERDAGRSSSLSGGSIAAVLSSAHQDDADPIVAAFIRCLNRLQDE